MEKEPVFWGKLDDNIVNLVFTLNELPGIVTIASCGGHPDSGPTQHPDGEWFVGFEVREQVSPFGFHRSAVDWQGIMHLLRVMECYDKVKLELTMPPGRPPLCYLRGESVDPDDMASTLLEELQGQLVV